MPSARGYGILGPAAQAPRRPLLRASCHAPKRSGRSVAFPPPRPGLRAASRPCARPRFGPSSLTDRFSALLVTLRNGQGARPLSLRLEQDPVPLRGPWAFALAPLQAPSLTASPRFRLAAAVVAAAAAVVPAAATAAAAAVVIAATATAATAVIAAAPAVPAAAAAAQQEDQDDDPPAAPTETTIVTTTHDFVTSHLMSRSQRPAPAPRFSPAPEPNPVAFRPPAGFSPRFCVILCGGRQIGSRPEPIRSESHGR